MSTVPRARDRSAGPLRVGYLRDGYAERRSIFGAVRDSMVEYRPVRRSPVPLSWSMAARRVARRFSRTCAGRLWDRSVVFRASGDVDLIHGFNDIGFGDVPWISTFETILPRYHRTLQLHHGPSPGFERLVGDRYVERAVEALAAPSCRAIIAMSECNLSMQRSLIHQFPDLAPRIEGKLLQLHPPQQVHGTARSPSADPHLELLFVGGAFFRKGGLEMLKAVARVRRCHPVRLTIVSGLYRDPYARHETREHVAEARALIDGNRDWIRHYEGLENDEVLRLMRAADVGLLPTWADTYGFVVLEFQAGGCPVITTDVRALAEINDPACGWLIEVPRNELGEGIYSTNAERTRMAQAIEQGVEAILDRICEDPSEIHHRSVGALERIRAMHDPDRYARQILDLYRSAVP